MFMQSFSECVSRETLHIFFEKNVVNCGEMVYNEKEERNIRSDGTSNGTEYRKGKRK